MQNQFFKIADASNANTTTTGRTKTAIQEFTVDTKIKLLQKMNEYRHSRNREPWLISYKYSFKG